MLPFTFYKYFFIKIVISSCAKQCAFLFYIKKSKDIVGLRAFDCPKVIQKAFHRIQFMHTSHNSNVTKWWNFFVCFSSIHYRVFKMWSFLGSPLQRCNHLLAVSENYADKKILSVTPVKQTGWNYQLDCKYCIFMQNSQWKPKAKQVQKKCLLFLQMWIDCLEILYFCTIQVIIYRRELHCFCLDLPLQWKSNFGLVGKSIANLCESCRFGFISKLRQIKVKC